MKVKQMMVLLAAAIVLLAVAGCGGTPEGRRHNPVIQTDPGRDYASIPGGADLFRSGGTGSLTINNRASFDILIFAGRVDHNNLLGGIRAQDSRTFDLDLNPYKKSRNSLQDIDLR